MASPRYWVGIDLGTTNTVVAYADRAAAGPPTIEHFAIEQLVALGEVAARPSLPSFRYHPAAGELNPGDLRLPWSTNEPMVTGALARELGAQVPGRLVASAKSWLSHRGVDRTAPILPWGAEGVDKVSPVTASAGYLAHVRAAWNRHFPNHPLEQQTLVLTVPASFDDGARALTVEAAKQAGLGEFRLLEEPQAALYDWLYRHREAVRPMLDGVRLVLVCDVGGGTTDLTLVRVQANGAEPLLTRVGVGDHLMLGGDNIDLALAHVAESRLAADGARLDAARFSQLVQQCRRAKERLLRRDAPDEVSVTVLGTGARLVGAARTVTLQRDEVARMVVDGFFPLADADERPQRSRGGLVEFGLPYAADAAVTRHLAAFLDFHAAASREALGKAAPADRLPVPDAVLLNGGVFHAEVLRERLLATLERWRGAPPRLLKSADPDLSVARGAVAYALARTGAAPRIGGGAARSYFLELEGQKRRQGVCVLPRGTEEAQPVSLPERTFALRLKQPVRFHLTATAADTLFRPGDLVELGDEHFEPLPPLATVLAAERRGQIPVRLESRLTEVGTLELQCVSAEQPTDRWQLAFELREPVGGGNGVAVESVGERHTRFDEAASLVERLYGPPSEKVDPKAIKRLRSDLEKRLGPRADWEPLLLRELFDVLLDGVGRRRRSADHERSWFSLAGYCLRPGFGHPLDDWRIGEVWPLFEGRIHHVKLSQVWSEWWTFWRRIAGGLDGAAQNTVFDAIRWYLQPLRLQGKRPPGVRLLGEDDMIRLAGSLERITTEQKIEAGNWLLERLQRAGEGPHTWWALGRLGARHPFYGSAHAVVPATTATAWLEQLFDHDWKANPQAAFAAAQIARLTGDRERDLPAEIRDRVAGQLSAAKAPPTWVTMVREVVVLEEADENRAFGESLPPGLKLIR